MLEILKGSIRVYVDFTLDYPFFTYIDFSTSPTIATTFTNLLRLFLDVFCTSLKEENI